MKKEKKFKPTPTILGRCSHFTSWYCPSEIFSLAFKIIGYDERKKEIERAAEKLSIHNRATCVMNHEFSAYGMFEFGFAMGYIMGQLYNVKDREHLPKLKKLFLNTLWQTERRAAEKKGLPYLGKATKNLEKRKAA